jgi:hypothetical protein
MVNNTQNHWVGVDFVYRPEFQITRKHNLSDTGSVQVSGKRDLICWIPYKELTSVTG